MSTQKQRRGFATLTPEQMRAIASAGGKAAHEQGLAHQFTSAEASAAGKKGGVASGAARRARREEKRKAEAAYPRDSIGSTHTSNLAGQA